MTLSDLSGLAGGALTLLSAVYYVPGILRGEVHPHLFTWLIWTFVLLIGAAAQFVGGAGWGTAALSGSAITCFAITLLSIKHGEKDIRPTDWAALVGALAAIPLWMATDNPLGAVLLVTFIDLVGYWPTVRKTWTKPWDEVHSMYSISGVGYCFALAAIPHWTLVTSLHAGVLVFLDFGLTTMIILRRRMITKPY